MIKTILENIETQSEQLYQCLSEEHNALCNNQYQAIMSLAEQKQNLALKLDELDRQRQQLSGNQAFDEYLLQSDPSQELSRIWQRVKEQVLRCQHQNDVNGRLLIRRNQMAREMINIFTGRQGSDETTYGPNGKTSATGPNLTNTQV